MPLTGLAVAVAAGIGALARYGLDQYVQRRHDGVFPAGTLAVNVTGSFALGVISGLALHHGLGDPALAVLAAGFTGGYTTFSTWTYETLALATTGSLLEASANIVVSLAAGVAAAAAGFGLALL